MKKRVIKTVLSVLTVSLLMTGCSHTAHSLQLADSIDVKNIAQNPEGIEYDKNDHTFLLSSLNATPIIKVNQDGSYKAFTSGEPFPLSTAGLQIDYKNNRLLVAGFNGMEIIDKDPKTKGVSFLRMYDLKTGKFQKEVNLSHLVPDADAYFANDIAVDDAGNVYISDWYAHVIYKVDLDGNAMLFWKNNTGIASGPNGLDYHKDGYLLVSLLNVDKKGLYSDFALVKIPLDSPQNATLVEMQEQSPYRGFDGMVIDGAGDVVGVSNDHKTAGGNLLLKLRSNDNFKSAKAIAQKSIKPSTTVALTEDNTPYIIHQDFSDNAKKEWEIEQVKF